jgi:KDO2-lipid IV(A) lauroyltransferase
VSRERTGLRNRAEFAVYRLARATAGSLSPRAGSRVGDALGAAFHRVATRRREILEFNLRLAYPELDADGRRRMGVAVSRHFGRVLVDSMRLQRLEPGELLAGVEVHGREQLEDARARGRGVFFLSAHLGSWEVAALTAGLELPNGLSVVNRPLDNPLLDRELERFRARFGNRALGKREIARDVLTQLRRGGAVGILIDQRVPPDVGVEVPFFGHPTWTHPVLARFARRTRAPVVPAFALWAGPGRYVLRYGRVIDVEALPPAEREDVPLTARFSAATEAAIRRRPEQWLWFHDRWRHLRSS